jgi:hypothetical protein
MRYTLAALAILVGSATVHAQTTTNIPPTGVDILVIPSTGDPATVAPITNGTRSHAISATSALCNQAPGPAAPAGPVTNPQFAYLADPFTAGRECRVAMPPNLPDGTYRVVARFTAPSCTVNGQTQSPCVSPRSAVAANPLAIAQILILTPAVPTGLGVRP